MDGFIPFGCFWTSEVGSVGKEPVLEVFFFYVVIVTRVQLFFLVKLHVLRPVACYYSKMLGEMRGQIASFHDNVSLTLQNEWNRIRKHIFSRIPYWSGMDSKQVATVTSSP